MSLLLTSEIAFLFENSLLERLLVKRKAAFPANDFLDHHNLPVTLNNDNEWNDWRAPSSSVIAHRKRSKSMSLWKNPCIHIPSCESTRATTLRETDYEKGVLPRGSHIVILFCLYFFFLIT